jgi:glycosyltransferase involved in cell wall biosynthesis
LLDRLAAAQIPCLIVDDGSNSDTRRILEGEAEHRGDWVMLLRRESQGGKGAAVMDGLRALHRAGFTHALQVDADGQHDTGDVQKFLAESRHFPRALILGRPVYGPDVPKVRLAGRQLSRVLVWFETLSFDIADPLMGYRVYPLQDTVELIDKHRVGPRMDFDPEIAVRLKWRGLPVRNIATAVSYPQGVHSNFRMIADNVGMVRLHVRLVGEMLVGRVAALFTRTQ